MRGGAAALGLIQKYLIQLTVTAFFGALLWLLFRPWRRARLSVTGRQAGAYREGILLLFFMFLSGLFALTLTPPNFWTDILILHRPPTLPSPFQGGVNLIPLRESWALYAYYLKTGFWEAILLNFLGNILMFLPIGLFTALLSDRPRWWKSTLYTLGTSLFIEVFQLFVSRGTDVDDLILNTVGGLAGYWLFGALRRCFPQFAQKCQVM